MLLRLSAHSFWVGFPFWMMSVLSGRMFITNLCSLVEGFSLQRSSEPAPARWSRILLTCDLFLCSFMSWRWASELHTLLCCTGPHLQIPREASHSPTAQDGPVELLHCLPDYEQSPPEPFEKSKLGLGLCNSTSLPQTLLSWPSRSENAAMGTHHSLQPWLPCWNCLCKVKNWRNYDSERHQNWLHVASNL